MKQSGRSRLPTLTDPQPLADALSEAADLRILCHESADPEAMLPMVLSHAEDARAISVLVGPEGGFSEGEVAAAEEAGWTVASLGPRRLRAETAAIVAAAAVMLHV